jgi:WD40 repeat protein
MRARPALGGLAFLALATFVATSRAGGPLVATLDGQQGSIACMAFSPDGRILAVGGGDDMGKTAFGEVKLWDVCTRQLRSSLGGHTHLIHALAFSPDGHTLATAGNDGTARLWDLRWRRERAILKGDAGVIHGVAFTPDGKALATGTGKSPPSVKLWEVATGNERARLPAGAGAPLAFVGQGKRLVTISASTIHVGDVALWQKGPRAFAMNNWGYSVAVSPDGKLLAAGGDSHGGWLWETATGKLRFAFPPASQGC